MLGSAAFARPGVAEAATPWVAARRLGLAKVEPFRLKIHTRSSFRLRKF
jgi:hypothetical protein